jgi:hypothetical protein
MENAVQVWAPWMDAVEAEQLMHEINRLPPYLRKPKARDVGQRLRLTYEQRKAWGIRTIAPCDMTEEELAERRKARKQYLRWLRRRNAGSTQTRAEYLASFAKSQNKQQPWEQEGISRSQWFARRAKTGPGVAPIKLNKQGPYPVQSQKEAIAKAS